MARAINIAPNRHATHPFDLRYGTDTGGYLSPDELRARDGNSAGPGKHTNNGYSAVAPSVFRDACRRWRESLPSSTSRLEAYTFVDVGAGKGRALLLAAEQPFRKIIGLEIDAALAGIAGRNTALWRRASRSPVNIRVRHEDALEFVWPRPPLLVYLNNPFDCALIAQLALRLAGAAAKAPGGMDILYVNPACVDALTNSRSFRVLWDAPIEMDAADRRADPYGATADRVAALRCCRLIP